MSDDDDSLEVPEQMLDLFDRVTDQADLSYDKVDHLVAIFRTYAKLFPTSQ